MSVTLRNRVSPWKSFLFELNEKDGFFSIYLSLFFLRLYRRVVWRLQKVSSFFHCSDTRVHFCFIFLISTTCFFFFKCNFLIKQKDKHWPFDLSSPLFLLTEATSWTLHPFRQVNRQSSLVSLQYCGKIPFRNMRHLYRIHIKKNSKKATFPLRRQTKFTRVHKMIKVWINGRFKANTVGVLIYGEIPLHSFFRSIS